MPRKRRKLSFRFIIGGNKKRRPRDKEVVKGSYLQRLKRRLAGVEKIE